MKIMPKMAEMSIILITVVVLLAPAIGFCDNLEAAAAAVAQAAVDQSAVNPGDEIGKAIGDAMGSMDMDMGNALLIPIMGIFGVFIAPMLAIIIIAVLAFRHRDRKEQRNHETIRQMIEKGIEIPPNISFAEEPESILRRGIKFIGIGAGLSIFFLAWGATEVAGIGAIPLFIGLAYLLIWHLEKKQASSAG